MLKKKLLAEVGMESWGLHKVRQANLGKGRKGKKRKEKQSKRKD